MFKFLKNHWKILALTALALAAAAVAIFFPPAILATLIVALANTSAFAIMGAAAMPVAIATAAAVAAATVYAVGGIAAGINWGVRKLIGLCSKGSGPKGSGDDLFNDLDTTDINRSRNRGPSGSSPSNTAADEEPVHHASPLAAPRAATPPVVTPYVDAASSLADVVVEDEDADAPRVPSVG